MINEPRLAVRPVESVPAASAGGGGGTGGSTGSGSGPNTGGLPPTGGETLGFPNWFPFPQQNVWSVLLPNDPSCEFGFCGNNFETTADAIRIAPPLIGACAAIPGCKEAGLIFGAGVALGWAIDQAKRLATITVQCQVIDTGGGYENALGYVRGVGVGPDANSARRMANRVAGANAQAQYWRPGRTIHVRHCHAI